MKKNNLKKLIKSILKEAVMSQMTPEIKTPQDAFYHYLYFVFNPVVVKMGKGKIQEEHQMGTLSWELPFEYNGKTYDRFYATPAWEDDMNKMMVQANDDKGTFDFVGEIPFPMKDWSMDANKDARRYIKSVMDYLKKSGFKFIQKEKIKEDSEEFKDGLTNTMAAVNIGENDDDDVIKGKFVNRGEVKLDGGLEYDEAYKIANSQWDIFGTYGKDERGVWNFKTRGDRWCCAVGKLNGKPALLSVTANPGRLQLLVGDELNIDESITEMSTSAGAGSYMTPFAFTKNKKGSPKGIAAAKKYGKVVGESEI